MRLVARAQNAQAAIRIMLTKTSLLGHNLVFFPLGCGFKLETPTVSKLPLNIG